MTHCDASDDPGLVAAAEAAYVFAYPLLLTRRALRDANRLVARPGPAGMLALSGWLDVGTEPRVVSVPDSRGRYYVLWLRDAWNTAFAAFGPRTTGAHAQAFAVLGPRHQGERLRPELTPVQAPTAVVRVSGRIEAPDAEAFLCDLQVCSAGRWHGGMRGAPVTLGDAAPQADPVEAVEALPALAYFREALSLAYDNPPEREDVPALDALRALLFATTQSPAALEAGARRAREAIRRATQDEAAGVWRAGDDVGRYGVDYLRRAAAARAPLSAEPATDEFVAVVDRDADGRPLTGADQYVLRFPADAKPPANACWSLATAAGSTGDLKGLMLDADGSLTIHIGREAPVDGGNWLAAPPEAFRLTLRLYWPREEALRGHWSPPAVERVAVAISAGARSSRPAPRSPSPDTAGR